MNAKSALVKCSYRVLKKNNLLCFLCSNAKQMPASVCNALKEAFQQEGALSSEEAEQMLAVMENSGRLQCETWS